MIIHDDNPFTELDVEGERCLRAQKQAPWQLQLIFSILFHVFSDFFYYILWFLRLDTAFPVGKSTMIWEDLWLRGQPAQSLPQNSCHQRHGLGGLGKSPIFSNKAIDTLHVFACWNSLPGPKAWTLWTLSKPQYWHSENYRQLGLARLIQAMQKRVALQLRCNALQVHIPNRCYWEFRTCNSCWMLLILGKCGTLRYFEITWAPHVDARTACGRTWQPHAIRISLDSLSQRSSAHPLIFYALARRLNLI